METKPGMPSLQFMALTSELLLFKWTPKSNESNSPF